jgi:hypothetical protein
MAKGQLNLPFIDDNHKGLIIKGKALNKDQQKFNSLVKEIQKLGKLLEECRTKLPEAKARVDSFYEENEEREAKAMEDLILSAYNYLCEVKLGVNKKELVEAYIVSLISEMDSDPSPAIIQIYDEITGESWEEEKEFEKNTEIAMKEDFFKQTFGQEFQYDPEKSDFENYSTVKEKIGDEAFEEMASGFLGGKKKKPSRKNQKQLEAELQKEKEEEVKQKSFKALYNELMKAFHPDKEQDPELKKEKEEVSKKITEAYRNKNYFQLLSLESEFLLKNADSKGTSEEQIRLYIKILNQQKAELKMELDAAQMVFGPIFSHLMGKYKGQMEPFMMEIKRNFESDLEQRVNRKVLFDKREKKHKNEVFDFIEMDLMESSMNLMMGGFPFF